MQISEMIDKLNRIKEIQAPKLQEKYKDRFKRLSPDWAFELELDGSGYFKASQWACGEEDWLYSITFDSIADLEGKLEFECEGSKIEVA